MGYTFDPNKDRCCVAEKLYDQENVIVDGVSLECDTKIHRVHERPVWMHTVFVHETYQGNKMGCLMIRDLCRQFATNRVVVAAKHGVYAI